MQEEVGQQTPAADGTQRMQEDERLRRWEEVVERQTPAADGRQWMQEEVALRIREADGGRRMQEEAEAGMLPAREEAEGPTHEKVEGGEQWTPTAE
jgi:hypothetical protein